MTWWLSSSAGGDEAAKRADYPWLRHFDPGWQCTDQPADDVSRGAKWQVCTPETAGPFSGVGFFFAEALHAAHDVPIGLMQTGIAATWGENWISRAAMEADPEFRYCLSLAAVKLVFRGVDLARFGGYTPIRGEQWELAGRDGVLLLSVLLPRDMLGS